MNEEILRIQKMVAEGKVTPEEGAELVASVGNPASPPPNPEAATSRPAESSRKTLGIIALIALCLFFLLLALAWSLQGSAHRVPSAGVSSAAEILAEILPVFAIGCLLLGIILGFVAWRTIPGQIAAIGGLLVVIGVPVAHMILMI